MSTASTPTMPVAPSQPGLSEPERLINVFFAPTKTFADIRRNASWWVPWLILSIISVMFTVVLDKQVGFDQVSENQIKMSPRAQERMEQLTPEQQQRQIHASAQFFKWAFGYLAPATNLIFIVIVAAVLLGTFNFGVGTEVTFKQSIAITAYAFLIRCLHAILAGAAAIANSDPTTFNISNPVGTNPAFFMSFTETPRFLYSVLASFDVTNLWLFAVLGIGFAVVGRKKIATGLGVMAGWFIVMTLLGAGLAAAFS